MIADKDRSGFFGASDSKIIMGNWRTKTFAEWWQVKLGVLQKPGFTTRAMAAGSAYEHRILDALEIKDRDRQVIMPELRLRVNLDGETEDTIKEVKTTGKEPEVSKAYWYQAQVEMYATGKKLDMVFYKMTDAEYENFFLPIDKDRVTIIPISYDEKWVHDEYLPRLKYLSYCLDHRFTPRLEEFNAGKWINPFDFRRWTSRYADYVRLVLRRICVSVLRQIERLQDKRRDKKVQTETFT